MYLALCCRKTCPEIVLKFSKKLVLKFYFVLLGPLRSFFVRPPVTDSCGGGMIFSSCECVLAWVPKSLLARYLKNQRSEFHQTLVDGVVEATDELTKFEVRRFKVKVARRPNV